MKSKTNKNLKHQHLKQRSKIIVENIGHNIILAKLDAKSLANRPESLLKDIDDESSGRFIGLSLYILLYYSCCNYLYTRIK